MGVRNRDSALKLKGWGLFILESGFNLTLLGAHNSEDRNGGGDWVGWLRISLDRRKVRICRYYVAVLSFFSF